MKIISTIFLFQIIKINIGLEIDKFINSFNRINLKEKRFNGKLELENPNIDHTYSYILIPDAINVKFKQLENGKIIGILKPGLFFLFGILLWFGFGVYFLVDNSVELGILILISVYIMTVVLFIIGVESTKLSIKKYLELLKDK